MPAAFKRAVESRSNELLLEQQHAVWRQTSTIFGWLLLAQWVAGIVVAIVMSPYAWEGSVRSIHEHVYAAIVFGAAIIALPVYRAFTSPCSAETRHCVAMGQMLISALLIHLTGGRIETHFHVFGSLAFLSFYRDWRVLITATLVVLGDHVLRGFFFPQSVYGVATIEPMRWLEHGWWVLFEDIFLVMCCSSNFREMQGLAHRQAEVEVTRARVEELVKERTVELAESESRASTLYAVSRFLSDSQSLSQAVPKIVRAIGRGVMRTWGPTSGIIWEVDEKAGTLSVATTFSVGGAQPQNTTHRSQTDNISVLQVLSEGKVVYIGKNSIAFPILADASVIGVVEMNLENGHQEAAVETSLFESIGRQLGQFIVRRDAELENIHLAKIVQSSRDAIISLDLDGTITSWNRGAEEVFGYSANEARSSSITKLIPTDGLASCEKLLADGHLSESIEEEDLLMRKDGSMVAVAVSRSPVRNESGVVCGAAAIIRDITERKEAEKRVSEFYSIVSHELRTPLTSVRGALGLIENGVVENGTDEALELVKVGRESADRLIRLINDMLDLKKLEAGKMELVLETVRVDQVVTGAMVGLTGMAEEANIKLIRDIEFDCTISADADRMVQVLTNLISNGIKFSQPGGRVTVSTRIIDERLLRFSVTDQGCGIPTQEMHKLFGKFQQLDASDTRQKGGSGLGLSICKALVEEHDGRIGVESTVGKGSTFWFDIPISVATDKQDCDPANFDSGRHWALLLSDAKEVHVTELDTRPIGDLKVLIADDDEHLRLIMTRRLTAMGLKCFQAADGIDAIALARAETPDLIILDIGMPYIDGFKVVEVLSSEDNCVTPLIVYSGQDLTAAERSNLKLGSTRYVSKSGMSDSDIECVVRELLLRPMQARGLTTV